MTETLDAEPQRAAVQTFVVIGVGIVMTAAVWVGVDELGPLPPELDPVNVAAYGSDDDKPVPAVEDSGDLLQRSQNEEQRGDLDAAAELAEQAARHGGGRDAAVQAAKIAILQERYDDAEGWLRPLLDRPDPAVRYNLALVAHHRGKLEEARTGYERTLELQPRHAEARYNLAYVHWQQGELEHARRHADAFARDFPSDPRGEQLRKLIAGPR